jgi:hypothetical protein
MKKYIQPMCVSINSFILLAMLSFLPWLAEAQISFKLKSPLDGINSIETLITAILGILIVIATPIVVICIIYAGFLYVTAQGNAEQIKQATRALTYAIIGGVLIIGAVAIAGIIEGVVTAFKAP